MTGENKEKEVAECSRQERIKRQVAEEAVLVDELNKHGIDVTSVSQLYKRDSESYLQNGVPILLKYLTANPSPQVLEGIARALDLGIADDEVNDALIDVLYKRKSELSDANMFAIGGSIAGTASSARAPILLRLAADESIGSARWGPIVRMAQIRYAPAKDVVLDLLSKGEELEAAVNYAAQTRLQEALPLLDLIADMHKDKYFKKLAQKAATRIRKPPRIRDHMASALRNSEN